MRSKCDESIENIKWPSEREVASKGIRYNVRKRVKVNVVKTPRDEWYTERTMRAYELTAMIIRIEELFPKVMLKEIMNDENEREKNKLDLDITNIGK